MRESLRQLNKIKKKTTRKAIEEYYSKINNVKSIEDLWKLLKKAKSIKGSTFKNYRDLNDQLLLNTNEIEEDIFNHFIPNIENEELSEIEIHTNGVINKVTEDELRSMIKLTNNNKAPGYDKISYKVLKKITELDGNYLVKFYNACLRHLYFPKTLKKGQLILFQKPGKKLDGAKSLRPITLLPVIGKMLEKIIINRINNELSNRKFTNERQHGFRKGKSTIDAIEEVIKQMRLAKLKNRAIVIAMDISGAFDRIKWSKIIDNLTKSGIEGSYLELTRQLLIDREIEYDGSEVKWKRETKIGCPQGGMASPSLWVYGMNDLLVKLNKTNNITATAYADDLVIVIKENNLLNLKNKIKVSLEITQRRCSEAGLELNSKKTQWMDIGRMKSSIDITIKEETVKSDDSIKYLGVMLNDKLNWKNHIKYIEEKSCKFVSIFNKLQFMNKRLTLENRMRLYRQVYLPMITYGNKIWFTDLKYEYQKESLNRMQRRVLLSITKCYITTSNIKLQKITGQLNLIEELRWMQESSGLKNRERRLNYLDRQTTQSKKNSLRNRETRNYCGS